MANRVFATRRGVSPKGSSNNTIAAWPDVCITPVSGPIPLPYVNAVDAMAANGDAKSKKVQKTLIDTAHKAGYKHVDSATGVGVVSHTMRGKVYFTAHTMDVKFQGKDTVRLGDPLFQNKKNIMG